MVDGGPRKGSKYATLTDILDVCHNGAKHGLSHAGEPRIVGGTLLVWREVLHHESGEQIYAEFPIPVPDKGLPGQRCQDLGSGCTYARKYCLQGLYGLFADDGLDPDEISYGDAGTSKASAPAPTPSPAPMPVTVEKPESPVDDSQRLLTATEIDLCKEIIKDKEHGDEWKAEFKKRFFKSSEKLMLSQITRKEHLDFLTLLKSGVPF